MRKHAYRALLVCILSNVLCFGAKLPFNFDAMMRITRIDDPQPSPDGTLVAFTAQTVDLANNTKPIQIYLVPVAGGAPMPQAQSASLGGAPLLDRLPAPEGAPSNA